MWDLLNSYVGTLIVGVFSILFVKYVMEKTVKSGILFSILLMITVPVLINFSYLFNQLFLKTLLSCLLSVILFKCIFKIPLYQSILYAIIFMIMLTISEIVVFIIITMIFSVGNYYLYNTFAGSVFSNFLIAFNSLLLGLLFRKLLRKVGNFKLKNYLMFYMILLFICIIIFFYITFSNIGNGIGLVSGLTVICVMLIVLISLLFQAYKNNELTIKYDKLLDFIKKYEIEIDNQRMMHHEIKNQLLTIKSKIIDKDKNQNIINYINEILDDNSKEINHTIYAKLNSLPPNGLKGLFYFKISEAHDKKIKVSINISKSVENSILNNLTPIMFNQVGKLFGILLDNAIESAELTNDKMLGIEVYVVSNQVNFIVSNSYVGNGSLKIGIFSHSTKGEGRGHGLLLAKAIISSNNRFELVTEITDELYIQKLIIKK